MTNDDIIKAAYKVWGQDLYRTTSLTDIARELGVSKPALYRHFKDKDAILDAMYTAFFDDCAGFIKNGYNKALKTGDTRKSYLIWLRTIAEYYAQNKDAFIFSLIQVFSGKDRPSLNREFFERGIDFQHPALNDESSAYPSKMQLGMATCVFCLAHFHSPVPRKNEPNTAETIKNSVAEVEKLVTGGLCLDAKKVASLNFKKLEEEARKTEYEDTETNALLRAVAAAVGEAGPWHASMEMVAKRCGLSKSGLYAHFKNKQDMISRLFISEFTRIVKFAKAQIETTAVSEEQVYLTIISIVNYLRARPEILQAVDWIKTNRLDLGKDVQSYLYRIIGTVKIEAIQDYNRDRLVYVAQWILFMIVNTLALWQIGKSTKKMRENIFWARNVVEIPDESFRILFRFIALGVKGLK